MAAGSGWAILAPTVIPAVARGASCIAPAVAAISKRPTARRCMASAWGSVTDPCAIVLWRRGAHASRALASQAIAGIHRTHHIDVQQVVIQSRAVSMTALHRLALSWMGRLRASTVICYASQRVQAVVPWERDRPGHPCRPDACAGRARLVSVLSARPPHP